MLKRFLIITVFTLTTVLLPGCLMVHEQIIPTTNYSLKDFKIIDGELLCLLHKNIWRAELSVVSGIMSEPSKTAYSSNSVSLLVFDLDEFLSEGVNELQVKEKIDIISGKSMFGNIHLSIINKNLLFGSDVLTEKPYFTLTVLADEIFSYPMVEDRKAMYLFRSLDDRRIYYTPDDTSFYVYDIENKRSAKLDYSLGASSPTNDNLRAKEALEEDDLFIELTGYGDHYSKGEKFGYNYSVINKKTDEILSEFELPSRIIYNLKQGHNGPEILTRFKLGSVTISDMSGHLLYSLPEAPIPSLLKAVFEGNRVIAAGISEHDDPLGRFQYIDFLIWDYKNNKVTRKSFRCGKAGLKN